MYESGELAQLLWVEMPDDPPEVAPAGAEAGGPVSAPLSVENRLGGWAVAAAGAAVQHDAPASAPRSNGRVPSLPPGPSMPRPLLTLGWITRPRPLLERFRAEFGDTFTFRLPHETTWVMLSNPEDVKTVFKGDPRLLHA